MPFSNSGQGMAQKQGTPPLNAFDSFSDGVGATVNTFIPEANQFDVHAYQSLNFQCFFHVVTSTGTPQNTWLQFDWYADGGNGQLGQKLAHDEYYATDDNINGVNIDGTLFKGTRILTPVKGYYLVITNQGVGFSGASISYTLVGQYTILDRAVYYCDSAYWGVSGLSAKGNMFDRLATLSGPKAAGVAQIIDYPPTKSGDAFFHALASVVTVNIINISLLDQIANLRIAGFAFPVSAFIADQQVPIVLPNRPIAFLISPQANGVASASATLTFS